MTKWCLIFWALMTSVGTKLLAQPNSNQILESVDPFIGTGGHGHTFPGATRPFGMMQLSPDTRLTGWDGCSGYHYSDDRVYGFSHTHLSGTGVSDYGDLLLMPYTGETYFNNGSDGRVGYSSPFSKKYEAASPGYYTTLLAEDRIKVELSTTLRAGMHQYLFPDKQADQQLLIDLVHRDEVLESQITLVSPTELEGYRHSKAWATDQRFFFVIQTNKPILDHTLNIDGRKSNSLTTATDQSIKAAFNFGPSDTALKIRVGISAVDIAGARKNLSAEIDHWDFQRVKQQAAAAWAKELGKIKIQAAPDDLRAEAKKKIFYTALYHTMIAPNLYSDVDGRYRGTDRRIHTTDQKQYTVFSLWDTYRAAHPLYTLIDQKRTTDFIGTFLRQYQDGGSLPMWELGGNYTQCMIGYHAAPVIVDAYMKDIPGIDSQLALQAMIQQSNANELGKQAYAAEGLLTTSTQPESVSKTLEYAFDDWTIARMAEKMGQQKISHEYYERSQNYKNVFDPTTGFMRARTNNKWFYPFDPSEVNYNYTEANSWQYSFYVPHDIEGWTELIGGLPAAEQKLDALFEAPTAMSGRHQVDITGLIGQYAHGNEPSHHIAYMYNYLGRPYKTQKYVRQIMDELYQAAPAGLSGNEDCGQMSAWLVLSALGFYPVTPGSNDYMIGSPWFDSAIMQLENGQEIKMSALNNSNENVYIQKIISEGQELAQSYLTHEFLMTGPEIQFHMGPEPNYSFGSFLESLPLSSINAPEVVAIPTIITGDRSFTNSTLVELQTATKGATIYYQINHQPPQKYEQALTLNKSTKLTTWATKDKATTSKKAVSYFNKLDNKKIELHSFYAAQYSAGGDKALIDKIRGGTDYRNGNWQGYEQGNLEAVIDLGQRKKISEIRVGFLQDENSWIFMPTQLEIYTGKPGAWKALGTLINDQIDTRDKGSIIKDFVVRAKAKTRYVKVVAINRGTCPDHHKGAGHPAWIFSDEIVIKP